MLYLTRSWVQEPRHWLHGLWTEALSALTLNRTLCISQTSACDKSPSRFSHPPRRRPEKVGDGRHTDPELFGRSLWPCTHMRSSYARTEVSLPNVVITSC